VGQAMQLELTPPQFQHAKRLNTTTHQQKYKKLFKSFAQKKANNSKHGHSQSQIFTEANMLITPPTWYVVKCSLWRPNILPFFVHGW